MAKPNKIIFLLFLFIPFISFSKEYIVHTAEEISKLNLMPGDRVLLAAGKWDNQHIKISAKGNETQNIIFSGAKNGETVFGKGSSIVIEGSFVVVENLKFFNPYLTKGTVVLIGKNAKNCRFTNNVFIEENNKELTKDKFFAWIMMFGQNNRIDHCYFKGKTNKGCYLVAEAEEKPSYNKVDHNFFDYRPELGMNGGEAIRVGNWNTSMYDSHITVEKNIFRKCNGEIEIISNKSCKNIIRNNLFFESIGTLCLRHGKSALVEDNVFIGNGVASTGGIRITGENHIIRNNYFNGIKGDGFYSPISFRNAWENPPLHGYDQIKNVKVYSNTFVDTGIPFLIGAGKDEKSVLPPISSIIANNIYSGNSNPLQITESKFQIDISNNFISASNKDVVRGFEKDYFKRKKYRGLANLSTKEIAIMESQLKGATVGSKSFSSVQKDLLAAKYIGPSWYNFNRKMEIR